MIKLIKYIGRMGFSPKIQSFYSSLFTLTILGIWNLGFGTSGFSQDVTLSGSGSCGGGAVSGTWTVPCDVAAITVEVYGGGGGAGGGGGGSNGGFFNTRGGGGGGGGGYTTTTINVVPGSSFSYSIGSGGCGGSNGSDASDGGSGSAGGNSTFSGTAAGGTPVNLTANGGSSGSGGDGTEGSPGSGGSGGNASGGTTNTSGTAGSSGSGGNGGNGGNGAGPSGGVGGVGNTASGDIYGGGGAGGGNSPGGVGAAGGILITFTATTSLPVTPIISSTAATCTAEGTSTISNYDPGMTYIFTPSGPSAGAGGAISGMVAGTSYTVVAGTGNCASTPSTPFSNSAITAPAAPAITTTLPTCTSDGMSTINNYNGTLTYTFTPAGPSVGAGGAITGMVTGTSYTVLANDGTCSSNPSASFSNAAQFPTPVVFVSSSDADSTICNGENVTFTANPSGIANYNFLINGVSVNSGPANTYSTSTLTDGNTISVIATSSDGCVGNSTNSISFTVNPIPTVSLTASDDSICPGENVIFSAAPSGNSNYEFFNNGNSVQDSSSASFSTSSLVSGNSITVVATNLGCSSPVSNAISVYVFSAPVVSLSSSDADSTICNGDTVTFTVSPAGIANYNFFVNGNSVLSGTGNTYTTSALVNGNSITVIGTDFGCSSLPSNTITFTVNPIPTISISASSNTICQDSSVTFTAIPSGNSNYQFFINGNSMQTGNLNFYSSNTISNTDTITAITSNLSCVSALSNAISITVNPTPFVTLSASATQICEGDAVVFIASPSGYNNYMFVDGVNLLQNGADSIYIATALTPGNNIYVIATNLNCPSPQSNSISVQVNPLPVVFIDNPDSPICNGNSATLTANPVSGTEFNWSNGETGNPVTVSPSANTVYTVTVTDAKGCKNSNSASVKVNQINSVSAGSDVFVCNENGVQMNATPGFYSYQWIPAAGLSNANISNPVANPDVITTYAVVFTDFDECVDTAYVTAIPSTALADAGPDVTINYGQENPLAASGGVQYEWSPAAGLSCTNCQTPLASPTETTIYTLTIINENGCTAVDSVTVEVIVSTEVFVPEAFSPNGDGENDVFYVRGPAIAELLFQVYDRWGNKVFETRDRTVGWDGSFNGQKADAAVYVWSLYAKIVNGYEVKKKGDVVLVR